MRFFTVTGLFLALLLFVAPVASAADQTPTAAATAASASPSATATAAPNDNSTPKTAVPIQPDTVVSGYLEGDKLGKFSYYKFLYDGDGSTVTIDMEIQPDDILVLNSSGFKVTGPNPGKEYARGGVQKGRSPNVSGNVITKEAGTFYIQVYNFNPSTPIGFALIVSGAGVQQWPADQIPATPTPIDTSAAAGTDTSAAGADASASATATTGTDTSASASAAGTPALTGTATSGSTSASTATTTASSSASATTTSSSGSATPTAGATGASTKAGASASASASSAATASPTAGASAASGASPAAAGTPVPSPVPGASATPEAGMRGHLAKGLEGHFASYELTYPGDRAVYTIGLNVTPQSAAASKHAGFRVYGPTANKIYAQGGIQIGRTPNVSGDLISNEPGEYVVQVYNYDPDTDVDYEVTLTTSAARG